MYEAVKSIVRVGHDTSEVIEQMVGVKQGCVTGAYAFREEVVHNDHIKDFLASKK
jgi:hypothetical protein